MNRKSEIHVGLLFAAIVILHFCTPSVVTAYSFGFEATSSYHVEIASVVGSGTIQTYGGPAHPGRIVELGDAEGWLSHELTATPTLGTSTPNIRRRDDVWKCTCWRRGV